MTQCPNCSYIMQTSPPADIMWIGLSMKANTPALDPSTASGKLISAIQHRLPYTFYATNLVKCAPLQHGKLRYPTANEKQACMPFLIKEIAKIRPKIIFLLGKQVTEYITHEKIQLPEDFSYMTFKKDAIIYVPIHHPAYISTYKRKAIDTYIKKIQFLIDSALKP